MASSSDVDPHQVLAALGIDGVEAVEPLNGGVDTLMWRVEAGGRYALRVFSSEQQDIATKEGQLMPLLGSLGFPVPGVRAAGHWGRRPALLIDWVEGDTFTAAMKRRPWRAVALGECFGRAQAQLHALKIPPERLPTALRNPKHSWIDWSHPDERGLRAELYRLRFERQVLIHLDYHPMNALTDGDHVSAVLDWSNARVGDPRADVARTECILALTPRSGASEAVLARLFMRGWRRGYREVHGPLQDMPLFRAWAGAATLADLLPHRNTRGFPETFFAAAQRWTERWKERAGVA